MSPAATPLTPLVESLHAQGRLRVWSLVITVFGDMALHRGGALSTAQLQEILGRVGVEPGALRTALSRLARDGWVQAHRRGRTSQYRLCSRALEQARLAAKRIYAPERPSPNPAARVWLLALHDSAGFELEGRCRLLAPGMPVPAGAEVILSGPLQRLATTRCHNLLGKEHLGAAQALARDLRLLASLPPDLSAQNQTTARLLLIHRWRRLILRFPEAPAELFAPEAGLSLRTLVGQRYGAIWEGSERYLDTTIAPSVSPQTRFRHGT